jgi:hypothetical protein
MNLRIMSRRVNDSAARDIWSRVCLNQAVHYSIFAGQYRETRFHERSFLLEAGFQIPSLGDVPGFKKPKDAK